MSAGWDFIQEDSWPFDLVINDEFGKAIISADRIAYSSGQKNLQECLDAVGFSHKKRQEVVDLLQQQISRMALMSAAPDLLRELKHLVQFMEPIEQTGLNIPGIATLNGARAAIAKAEGRA